MEQLKTLSIKYKTLILVGIALIFSGCLLMVRVKLNQSYFYLFLIWNLFLAVIPYGITTLLKFKNHLNKFKLGLCFLAWLAFLPNSPYIMTDFIHLRTSNDYMLWLDILLMLSFALTGLLLFYLSVFDMLKLLSKTFRKFSLRIFTIGLMFLCAFGVYLGRFLRYNSWEIISNPQYLISDIFKIAFAPYQHYEAWLFTLGFGSFLIIGFWCMKIFYVQEK